MDLEVSRFDGNHFPFCDAAIRVRHTNDLNADLSAPQCYCVRPFRVLQCLFYSSNQVFLFAPNFIPDLLQLGVRRVQTRTHFFLPTQIKPHPRKPETREHHRPVQLPKQSRARYYHPNESKIGVNFPVLYRSLSIFPFPPIVASSLRTTGPSFPNRVYLSRRYARKSTPDPEIINGQLVGHSIPAKFRPQEPDEVGWPAPTENHPVYGRLRTI